MQQHSKRKLEEAELDDGSARDTSPPPPKKAKSPTIDEDIEDKDTSSEQRTKPGYYLANFLLILDSVLARDAHLFIDEEMAVFDVFKTKLTEAAQKLYVRMFRRKGPWFRVPKLYSAYHKELSSAEIDDAIAILTALGFARTYEPSAALLSSLSSKKSTEDCLAGLQTLEELICLFTVPELREIVASAKLPGNTRNRKDLCRIIKTYLDGRRNRLLQQQHQSAIQANATTTNTRRLSFSGVQQTLDGRDVLQRVIDKALNGARCIRLTTTSQQAFHRVQRLFFLSFLGPVDKSLLVITNLKHVRYPCYQIDGNADGNRNHRVFPTRNRMLVYEAAVRLERRFEQCIALLGFASENAEFGENDTQNDTSGNGDVDIDTPDDPMTDAMRLTNTAARILFDASDPQRDPFHCLATNQENVRPSSTAVSTANIQPPCSSAANTQTSLFADFKTHIVDSNFSGLDPPAEFSLIDKPQPCEAASLIDSASDEYTFLSRFHPLYALCRLVHHGVSLYEKAKFHREAVALLRLLLSLPQRYSSKKRRGHWWVRLATNLEVHLKRPSEALAIAEVGLADLAVVGGPRRTLQQKVLRLAVPPRRWRRPVFADYSLKLPRTVTFFGERVVEASTHEGGSRRNLFAPLDGGTVPVDVEAFALQKYALPENGEWSGVHCEGGVFAMLFGLLLWEQMFATTVPGVFQTPFQDAPLDLGSDSFYSARKEVLEKRFSEISASDGVLADMIGSAWDAYTGIRCHGVRWDRWSRALLVSIGRCLKGHALAGVLRIMAEDYTSWRSGLPDLLLWREEHTQEGHTGPNGRAKLAEVKGPGDRLSDMQHVWLDRLLAEGWEVEVCYVRADVPRGETATPMEDHEVRADSPEI